MAVDKSIHEELAKAVEDEVEVDSVAKEWLAERAAQETVKGNATVPSRASFGCPSSPQRESLTSMSLPLN